MLPTFIFLGVVTGLIIGLLGIGGGIVLVPGLIYLAGFSSQKAIGTSIAVLLPPVGIAAALEYYRQGNVDFKAALIIALTVMFSAWIAAYYSKNIPDTWVKTIFGISMVVIGTYMVISNAKKIFA